MEDKTRPVLYQIFCDIAGREQEIKVRQDLLEAMDRLDPWRLLQSAEALVPIPSTSNVLGALKGNVDLTFTYKKFGNCTGCDRRRIMEFCEALNIVVLGEQVMLNPWRHLDGL